MKKRILAVVLVAMLLLNLIPASVSAAATPKFAVETVTANAGETVDVTISVKNNPGIASIKLKVEYDPSLTLNSITYNAAIGGISQQPQKMSNPVILNWVNATANTYGDWVFATLSFTVAKNATGGEHEIRLSYEPDNVYNIAEENIFFEIENGAVVMGCTHDEKTGVPAKNADCTNNGNNLYYTCNTCGAALKSDGETFTTVEAETIPALGHVFGEWGANGSNEDEERRDCKNCDHFETRKVGATTAPTFIVETVTANAGETVNVAISVKNNPGIASIKLNVEYDPDLVLNSITYNTAIGGISQQPQKMSNPVILNWVNATANTNGDWVFATLSFTVAKDASNGQHEIRLSYEPDNVYNIAEENLFFEIENGYVDTYEKPLPTAKVTVARMILGNELAMQFAFPQKNIVEGVEYVVSVTKTYADGRADKNILVPQSEWKTDGPYYYVSFNGIAAKEMGDEIRAQILTADGAPVGDVYTDSVRAYAIRQLRKATDPKTRTVYADLLNYGAAAQTYFGYDAEDLVTKELTETEKGYGTKEVKLENNLVKGPGYGASQLNLASSIQLRVKFNGIDSSMYAIVKFTNHMGREVEARVEGSTFLYSGTVVVVDQVVAADYNRDVSITVYDADGNAVASAVESVASYIARMSGGAEIYSAVAKYCAAAHAYLHRND